MTEDARFYETLDNQLENVSYEFRHIMGVIKVHDRPATQWWNNVNQRNKVFFDCATSLRVSSGGIIDTIQITTKKHSLHVHTIRVNVPDRAPESIFRILQREAVEFHIITEEFVTKAVTFLQSNIGSVSQFEELFNQGTKHLSLLFGARNCLQEELDKNNIPYNNATLPLISEPEEVPVDLDNVLSEFESASNTLINMTTNNSSNRYTTYGEEEYVPTEYTAPITNKTTENVTGDTIDQLASEFEALAESTTKNVQPGRGNRGRGRPRGRGGSRRRGNPAHRGNQVARGRGNPRGMARTHGNPNRVSTVTVTEVDRRTLHSYCEKLEKTADEVEEIIFNTNIDGIEGCETATKFVPTAKLLLTEMTAMEQFLISIGSPQVARLLRRTTLAFIHICKENFLQDIEEQEKTLIQENKAKFKAMLSSAALNEVPDSILSEITQEEAPVTAPVTPTTSYDYDYDYESEYNNPTPVTNYQPTQSKAKASAKPAIEKARTVTMFTPAIPTSMKDTDTSKTGAKPRSSTSTDAGPRCVTMFSAGEIPRSRTPSFSATKGRDSFYMGGARRGTVSHPEKERAKVEAKKSEFPPPLSRTDQRIRAVEEIFKSEKVYLSTLQRMIWMYKKPLAECKDSIISESELKDIFSNVEMMFQFNKKLMRDLERTRRTDAEVGMGDVFLENAPMMRLYSTYINNFEISARTLEHCKSRSAFQKLLYEYNTLANGGTMDLSAYLIQPVQRLPRYEMLVGAVVKLTDDGHPEKEKLIAAQKRIKSINDEVNESKRKAEKRDAVFTIEKKLQERPPGLTIVKQRREIIRSGVVQRVENERTRKTEKRMIHIFNDAILISKIRGNLQGNYTFKYKEFIEPSFCMVVQATDEFPAGLYISQTEGDKVTEEVWICENEAIRDDWIPVVEQMREGSTKL